MPDDPNRKEVLKTIQQVKTAAANVVEAEKAAAGAPKVDYTQGTYGGRIV